ncbi:UNVERIFIED_CONTAM: hypothetical protein BEN50_21750 [Euhalothece sp. KZN 001]
MMIECTIRRKNGTRATIGSSVYDFLPDEAGRHVCYVENPQHIKRFLETDAYRIADEAVSDDGGDDGDFETVAPDGEDDGVDAQDDAGEGADAPGAAAIEDMDIDALRARYTELLGRAPHPKATPETLRERIAEAWKLAAEG